MAYVIGDYQLDPLRRELRRGAVVRPVEPQVFDVLLCLIENRTRVVTKDDLLAAVWNRRYVSDTTIDSRISAARKAIGDDGRTQNVIRTVSRRGFRFVADVAVIDEGSAAAPREDALVSPVVSGLTDTGKPSIAVLPFSGADGDRQDGHLADRLTEDHQVLQVPAPLSELTLPDRPSIAVLPFENMSGDTGQEYFADGIVEDIITGLSRVPWLFVIARNSSFTYKGRAVDVRQVGRELGVRYVLEGSIRRSANRLRISGQLIDAATGTHLWADRFEGALEDVFDLHDQVTANIVGVLTPRLEQVEIERAKRKPTTSLDAYDCYLRGLASVRKYTEADVDEALSLFRRAFTLDPEYATAYALASFCYSLRKSNEFVRDRQQEIAETDRLARRARVLGRDDAVALGFAGFALANVVLDLDAGAAYVERALALNPSYAHNLVWSGWINIWLGNNDVAIDHLLRATRLSPLDPFVGWVRTAITHAHFYAGRYEEATAWAGTILRERAWPTELRIATASAAMAGRPEEAARLCARLIQASPTLRVSNLRDFMGPHRNPDSIATYAQALRRAGLPE